jgi:hypothetical protein
MLGNEVRRIRRVARARTELPDPRYHDQCRTQRQNIVVPKAGSTLRTAPCRRAIAMVDLSGRAKKSCPESSIVTDGRPEHSADRRGQAFPVGGHAQGTRLSTVASGFEVDVFYVRAVKASRM